MLKEDGDDNICFIHNHEIIRVAKVFVNTYHLWPRWINTLLKLCNLGGGFHSSIEILGKEFHFGGNAKQDGGIYESVPIHSLSMIQKSELESDTECHESDEKMKIAAQVGKLKERRVIGLWSGCKADIDVLMRHMKEQKNWKGKNYKTLSSNCNHFVQDACDVLMKESDFFYPAKGITCADKMVRKSAFFSLSLPSRRPLIYSSSAISSSHIVVDLFRSSLTSKDFDMMDSGEVYAFKGRARTVSATSSSARSNREAIQHDKRMRSSQRSVPETAQEQTHTRRQSLPECQKQIQRRHRPSLPELRELRTKNFEKGKSFRASDSDRSRTNTRSRASSKDVFSSSDRSTDVAMQSASHIEAFLGASSSMIETRSELSLRLENTEITHNNKENNSRKNSGAEPDALNVATYNPLAPVANRTKRLSAIPPHSSFVTQRPFRIEDRDEVSTTHQRRMRRVITSGLS
eukprot:g603.t2